LQNGYTYTTFQPRTINQLIELNKEAATPTTASTQIPAPFGSTLKRTKSKNVIMKLLAPSFSLISWTVLSLIALGAIVCVVYHLANNKSISP
jgi:hypothetical protein